MADERAVRAAEKTCSLQGQGLSGEVIEGIVSRRAEIIASEYADVLAENERLKEWKAAVEEAAVVNWTLNESNASDPRKAVSDLIACIMREAMDPMLSQPAADLHSRISELEQQVSELRAAARAVVEDCRRFGEHRGCDHRVVINKLDAAIDAARSR